MDLPLANPWLKVETVEQFEAKLLEMVLFYQAIEEASVPEPNFIPRRIILNQ